MRTEGRAFTLIEILLVIIIIAILASIILPVIANAKDAGLRAKGMLQAQQLGQAIYMYADQNDGDYCPSTNYGVPTSDPNRMWQNTLLPFVKSKEIFIAPGTKGAFATDWGDRGLMSFGLNSSTALDTTNGCSEDATDTTGCLAFKEAASFDKSDLSKTALLAVTPPGLSSQRYRGFEFSPYNGIPNLNDPSLSPPLTSDRDLVAELKNLPGDLIKPVYCRYFSDQHDHGTTPVVFADSHTKEYNVKQILSPDATRVWRFR